MSTEICAVGGRFLPGPKATICLCWDKHLPTDAKQGPRLSGQIAQHLFKVVGFALPKENTDLSGPSPSITVKKSSVHRTGQVSTQ